MQINSFDAVFFTASFLVPGFIWSSMLSMLVPRKPRTTELRMLEFLTLSCINYGLWSWALFLVFRSDFADRHIGWTALLLFVIIFLSPVGFGLLSGRARQKDFVSRLLARFGFRTVSMMPTAWDWHFSRQRPYWVGVRLTDGSYVRGLYGTESFAGDDDQQRDLYLEVEYRQIPSGDWAPVEDSRGVLIKADQICALEFREIAEVDYGD